MKLSLLILILSLSSFAMRVSVKEILQPDENSDKYLVLVSSGEVLELDQNEIGTLGDIDWAMKNNEEVEVEVKESRLKSNFNRNSISSTKLISRRDVEPTFTPTESIPTPLDNYKVAEAYNAGVIKKMFLSMRRNLREDSQCYNRAHIWVHELATRFVPGRIINLGKMWIFFTRKYIREYNYKWWFHAAPYTYLKGDSREIILDRTYHHSPRRYTNWKNMFMKNNAPCKMVSYYSDYNNNQESADCYTIKSSMYYYQPYQIEGLELGEKQKRGFVQQELELAYKDAL